MGNLCSGSSSLKQNKTIIDYEEMKKINEDPSLGIKTLIHIGKLEKKLNIHNVVFVIAPRINAAGRMDDAKKA